MSGNQQFPCTGCGACCRLIGKAIEAGIEGIEGFDRGDGVCKHLKDDNSCSIYSTRPDICNTNTVYEEFYKDRMSWDGYVDMSMKACEYLLSEFEKTK